MSTTKRLSPIQRLCDRRVRLSFPLFPVPAHFAVQARSVRVCFANVFVPSCSVARRLFVRISSVARGSFVPNCLIARLPAAAWSRCVMYTCTGRSSLSSVTSLCASGVTRLLRLRLSAATQVTQFALLVRRLLFVFGPRFRSFPVTIVPWFRVRAWLVGFACPCLTLQRSPGSLAGWELLVA